MNCKGAIKMVKDAHGRKYNRTPGYTKKSLW